MRLFVALELPDSWKSYLSEVQTDIERKAPGSVRWVQPELMHLTLLFLGDQPPDRLGTIRDGLARAAEQTAPFRLGPAALGAFSRGDAVGVIWAGIEDASAAL